MDNIIESAGLGKRYRRTWALRECTLAIPAGHIVALVGPNGAGKTTLLTMAVGLTTPTEGTVTVLGGVPAGSPEALDRIGFVAQDAPLYRGLPVRDMLRVARNLNRVWDQRCAEDRLAVLGIPLGQRVGELSGGQKAQLALTIALARKPGLLVLDEPLAALDPVARDDFMASVVAAARQDGISVIMSSHVLAELERVATYLIVLTRGAVRVSGQVGELLAAHGAGLEEIALRYLRAGTGTGAAFLGALLRRTVAAIGATIVVYILLAIATATVIRPHYAATVSVPGWNSPGSGWVISTFAKTPGGAVLSQGALDGLSRHLPASVQNSPSPGCSRSARC
jgi:ABC-2 type transport system ATP-binding protein